MKNPKDILEWLREIKGEDINWHSGQCFGYVYDPGPEALKLIEDAFSMYMSDTVLDVKAFPSAKIMEAEISKFALSLLRANPFRGGSCFTTGGTESIFLSVLAHREWARKEKRITQPNIVIPDTIHPAFNKACFYLGIKPIVVAAGPDFRADWKKMEYYVNDDTILVAGSAPSYGVGQIDPLKELGEIAFSSGIGFVVDACVGGGILPFLADGPELHFDIDGVTAITLDWHKWFMSVKGSSSVVYRDRRMLEYQTFSHSAWMGYSIVNPTVTSTRSAGHMAATVAIIKHFGVEGYRDITQGIMHGSEKIKNWIRAQDKLQLVGDPLTNVFAFTSRSPKINIFRLQEVLKKKGWFIQPQLAYGDMPSSCHISVNLGNLRKIDEFLEILGKILAGEDLSQETEMDNMNQLAIKQRDVLLKTSRLF